MPTRPLVPQARQATSEAAAHLGRYGLAEQCGLLGGKLLAPLTAAVSSARRARTFHPDGVVYAASVTSCCREPRLTALAERLSGRALVRFSSALWRGAHEWPDVLGAAIRFLPREDEVSSDQDLLLATIRFPWTMPFAPLATNFRSFLWNHYHAVSPFQVAGVGPLKLRLRSPRVHNRSERSRAEHLERSAADGRATFELQARLLDVPPLARRWIDLARLALEVPLQIDQAALRFSPFRCGRGLEPIGFVHALRAAAYAASQDARPAHA
jgi:hypothetical protein